MSTRKTSDAIPIPAILSTPKSDAGIGSPPGAAAFGAGANETVETASVSPRFASTPARLATALFSEATWAGGTDLSTSSATSRRFTVPGATLVCSTVRSTPNCVFSVLFEYCDWPFVATPAA